MVGDLTATLGSNDGNIARIKNMGFPARLSEREYRGVFNLPEFVFGVGERSCVKVRIADSV